MSLCAFLSFFLVQKQAEAQLKIPKTLFVSYQIEANRCQSLSYFTGSRIFIPQDAFVYKATKEPYQGRVILKYRETHDVFDFIINEQHLFVSQKQVLKSGGMFEIAAYTPDNKELEIREGKKIQVRFAAQVAQEKLDSYFLNPETNFWEKQQSPIVSLNAPKREQSDTDLWGGSPAAALPLTEEELAIGFGADDLGDWGGEWGDGWEFSPEDSLRNEVFKAMDIGKMGLHNYDFLLKEEEAIPLVAHFEVESTAPNAADLTVSKVYCVYEKSNAIVYYTQDGFSSWEKDFRLLPNEPLQIFCIFEDGSIAKLPKEKLPTAEVLNKYKNKKYTFVLQHEPKKPLKKEDLVAQLSQ